MQDRDITDPVLAEPIGCWARKLLRRQQRMQAPQNWGAGGVDYIFWGRRSMKADWRGRLPRGGNKDCGWALVSWQDLMGWRVRGDEDKFCWGTQPDSLQREGEASKWTVGWAVMQGVKAVCPGSCDGAALRMADSWKRMPAERVSTWWEVLCGAVLRGCFSCGGPWGPSRPSLVQEDERAFLASPHMPQGHS